MCDKGEPVDLAPSPPPLPACHQGVAGVSCLWRVADYWRELHGLPEALPAELAERLRPARHKSMHRVPSVQAAAAAAAGSDEEGGGREDEAEEDYNPEEEEEEMREEAEVHSDFDSDDGGWRTCRCPTLACCVCMPAAARVGLLHAWCRTPGMSRSGAESAVSACLPDPLQVCAWPTGC